MRFAGGTPHSHLMMHQSTWLNPFDAFIRTALDRANAA